MPENHTGTRTASKGKKGNTIQAFARRRSTRLTRNGSLQRKMSEDTATEPDDESYAIPAPSAHSKRKRSVVPSYPRKSLKKEPGQTPAKYKSHSRSIASVSTLKTKSLHLLHALALYTVGYWYPDTAGDLQKSDNYKIVSGRSTLESFLEMSPSFGGLYTSGALAIGLWRDQQQRRAPSTATELKDSEFKEGIAPFLSKLARYRPRIACFIGIRTGRIVLDYVMRSRPKAERHSFRPGLQEQVENLCEKSLDEKEDIFDHGFDSLCATILRLRITTILRSSRDNAFQTASRLVSENIVYNHPTIASLTQYLVGLSTLDSDSSPERTNEEAIEDMIAMYSNGLDTPVTSDPTSNGRATNGNIAVLAVVLLTGSTGNLGAQILADLLSIDSVASVYTVNRPSKRVSIQQRHQEHFQDKGLDEKLLNSDKLRNTRDWRHYLLPKGYDIPMYNVVLSQFLNLERGSTPEHLTNIMDNPYAHKLFAGTNVLCVGDDYIPEEHEKRMDANNYGDLKLEALRIVVNRSKITSGVALIILAMTRNPSDFYHWSSSCNDKNSDN
ncbi:hypothetical protein EV360DRAFT_90257 [Lentinula raphanica]|nr:hypothetical protein EV360DRAFT_90257 [Lentinula raphanica]